MSVDVVRRRFTVDEYLKMVETGILNEDDRVELLDGEVVTKTTTGPAHNASVANLNRLLILGIGSRGVLLLGPTVRLSKMSAPEPDLLLVRPEPRSYRDRYTEPGDVLLLIEVADSSLSRDRNLKLPLYAEAGIQEYWIVNEREQTIEVYLEPSGSGYRPARAYGRGETVSPSAFPDLRISLDEIFA